MPVNFNIANNRQAFRAWLADNHACQKECWLRVRRGRPSNAKDECGDDHTFHYLDAVEEALCFGWIDGHLKSFEGYGPMQRFTPRSSSGSWSELNKERVRRLERLGLMTDAGRACLPKMGLRSFRIDKDIVAALNAARLWKRFKSFPPLYQRVRADNIQRMKSNLEEFEKRLAYLVTKTREGVMYGAWDDYGRLSE